MALELSAEERALRDGVRRAAPIGAGRVRPGVALVLVALLCGCEPGGVSANAPEACAGPGARCALPDGPVGICERAPCPPGTTPPCFTCTPQH